MAGGGGAFVQPAAPGPGQRPPVAPVYRTLDQLLVQQKQIEKELFLRLRNLFSLNVDLVFYDLTSTYFEGHGPGGLARHGHSRDGKPRNRQVLVGLVMIEGWPIAHHVFQGNLRDATTVEKVLQDLQSRFGLRRVVFVGDRGMVTSGQLGSAALERTGLPGGTQAPQTTRDPSLSASRHRPLVGMSGWDLGPRKVTGAEDAGAGG